MEPFVLKIAAYITVLFMSIVSLTKSIPLRKERSTYVDWTNYNSIEPQGFGTYSFGYDIEDPEQDNIQFRDEERFPNGTVKGSYGYLRPDGIVHMVHYIADKDGYRATVEEYPRGQLKPAISPPLLTALQSKDVYKTQRVHEQRRRPADAIVPQDIAMPYLKTRENLPRIDNRKPIRVPNWRYSDNVENRYIFPNKIYF